MKKGVIQGAILSPKLFNIFYDTLIDKLATLKFFTIAYADDISLAFTSLKEAKEAIEHINA